MKENASKTCFFQSFSEDLLKLTLSARLAAMGGDSLNCQHW